LLADNPATGAWKTWWYRYDYALGFIAGWGVHPLDIALWGHPAMLDGPMNVEGRGTFPTSGACNTSIAWDVQFAFADGVILRFKGTPNEWNEANALNDFREWRERYGGIEGHGTAFEGTDGWICVHRGAVRASRPALVEEPRGPEVPGVLRSQHHQRNLVDAVRSRGPTVCPIEDAVQADILCHLADIATRVDRKLTWDPRRERFAGDAEANRHLELRPMRKPWHKMV
jgi:predicted dehydrogenase